MSKFTENPVWENGIYRMAKEDRLIAGPPSFDPDGEATGGFLVAAEQQLTNRTAYLKQEQDTIKDKLDTIESGAQVNTVTSVAGKTGAVTLNKSDVGLANVDNTRDLDKPVSDLTQEALDEKVDKEAGKGLSSNDFTAIDKARLDSAVLSYPDYATAAAAAATLPGGQVIEAPNADGRLSRFDVQSGTLIYKSLAADAESTSFNPAGAGATSRTVQDKMREWVSVKDFGAVGDGVTDDTAAIQTAISACSGKRLVFPSGYTFMCGPLTVSSAMSIQIDGVLKMRDFSGTLMTVSADDVTLFGSGLFDLNNTQNKGVQATGGRFHIHGLTFANMLGGPATSGSSSALNISGCHAPRVHDLKFYNIQKGTATAPYVSQPRAMSFDAVTGMHISDVLCEDVFCVAGVAAVQNSTFKNITANNSLLIVDNGLYIINSSKCDFDNFIIRGWQGEPIVFSGSSGITFNGGEVLDTVGNSCGFENSTNIEFFGTKFSSVSQSTVLKARTANTASSGISLIGVRAKMSGSNDLLAFYNGAANDIVVKGCVFEGVVDTEKSLNNVLLKLVTTNGFVIEDNTFILSEASSGAASAADWTITLASSEYSTFKRNTLVNRTASGRFRVIGTENNLIASDGLFNQANISGSRNPNYGLPTAEPRRFFGTSAPTAGTFVLADSVWNTAPGSSAILGWLCVAAGTPGTWVPFGGSFLSGAAVYNPPSLTDGAGITTTVSVPGAALGDIAVASFGQALQDVTVTAWVSAANTVSVRFQNESGSTIDLTQDTIRARVFKV